MGFWGTHRAPPLHLFRRMYIEEEPRHSGQLQVPQRPGMALRSILTAGGIIQLLGDVLPTDVWVASIWPCLDQRDRASVRATCRALRTLCNEAIESLSLGQVKAKSIPNASRRADLNLHNTSPPHLWLGPHAAGLFAKGAAPLRSVTSLTFNSFHSQQLSPDELQRLLAALPNLRSGSLNALLLPACFGALAARHCEQLEHLELKVTVQGGADAEADCDWAPDTLMATIHMADVLKGLGAIPTLRRLEIQQPLLPPRCHSDACFVAISQQAAPHSLSWRLRLPNYDISTAMSEAQQYCTSPQPEALAPLRALTALTRLEISGLNGCPHAPGDPAAASNHMPTVISSMPGGMAASLHQLHLPDLVISRALWNGVLAHMPHLEALTIGGLDHSTMVALPAAPCQLSDLAGLRQLVVTGGLAPVQAVSLLRALPALVSIQATVCAELTAGHVSKLQQHARWQARTLCDIEAELQRVSSGGPPPQDKGSAGRPAAAGAQAIRVGLQLFARPTAHSVPYGPYLTPQQAAQVLSAVSEAAAVAATAAPSSGFTLLGADQLTLVNWASLEHPEVGNALACLLGVAFRDARSVGFDRCEGIPRMLPWRWLSVLAQPGRQHVEFNSCSGATLLKLRKLATQLSACRQSAAAACQSAAVSSSAGSTDRGVQTARAAACPGRVDAVRVVASYHSYGLDMDAAGARLLRERAGEHPGVEVEVIIHHDLERQWAGQLQPAHGAQPGGISEVAGRLVQRTWRQGCRVFEYIAERARRVAC